MNYHLLEGLSILDLSERLPGPFSTFILHKLGANVTKLENADRGGDIFQGDEAKKYYPNFIDWYHNLNHSKEINMISFDTQQSKLELAIKKSDIILRPDNRFFNDLFKDHTLSSQQVIITLAGGKAQWKSIHDLNALALTETFSIHLEQNTGLPYLPFAGLGFGQFLATAMLAAWIKCLKTQTSVSETFYLQDYCIHILDILKTNHTSRPKKYLHNGLYPCYNVYQTQDKTFICLAALEEKYWEKLLEIFEFNLSLTDRFDTSGKIFCYLKDSFAKYSANDIMAKIKDQTICLTLVTTGQSN